MASTALTLAERAQQKTEEGNYEEGPAHPLWCAWTLWFDGVSKKRAGRTASWQDNLKEIYTFRTVEDFWSVMNNINGPSQLTQGSNYHMFKAGIKPMWEDDYNKRGGKWIAKIPKKMKKQLDQAWMFVALALIGENFKEGDEVCGAVVSIRQEDKLCLWTRTAHDRDLAVSIGRQLKDLLLQAEITEAHLVYQAHADSLQTGSSFGNKAVYYLD
eukprot:TRINITY_DN96809_c0_g1_i1.p1 TRINITY_DN96809_c0_g1~~TRINITY_DN96809_c0_g1_i1.p1  ORF type:complete len:214 (+),score=50.55 TRINITY_DN96809_c0_g1_i1:57-698(+)